jgi:hypothetical protein
MHCLEIGQIKIYMTNLLFIPYHNTGGHFIDWSLYFVTGQQQYAKKTGQLVSIVQDFDVVAKNWHQHQPVNICGFDDLKTTLKMLDDSNTNLYVSLLPLPTAVKLLFGVDLTSATPDQITTAHSYVQQDFEKMLQWTQNQGLIPVIFDYCKPDLLSIFYNNRYPLDCNYQLVNDSFELQETVERTFFSKITAKFGQQIWDQREKASLIGFHPMDYKVHQSINHSLAHLYYTTDDIWNNMPNILYEICTVLQLSIDPEKFGVWEKIYAQWRTVHDPYFGRHFDRIIDSIVNGNYMRLDRFKLNFFQEVLIQNALITQHNLNLKTWNLTKFPNNTQELHSLLEPNIHVL